MCKGRRRMMPTSSTKKSANSRDNSSRPSHSRRNRRSMPGSSRHRKPDWRNSWKLACQRVAPPMNSCKMWTLSWGGSSRWSRQLKSALRPCSETPTQLRDRWSNFNSSWQRNETSGRRWYKRRMLRLLILKRSSLFYWMKSRRNSVYDDNVRFPRLTAESFYLSQFNRKNAL